ncbi:MAG: 1-deoxy-D-xylulose-5-phosphate synthase [Bdellovibrionales bacterium]|nr:1-deoxy-D-xylulose-5-phosphate synthase [Bdellovibrionales bacterium]
MSLKLIDSITLPEGLRDLDPEQLEQVADELRDELIDSISESGGHFASSLGTNELTVALHHSFQTPDDKLIWDVGHQGYIHKMVTGRRDRMRSIRTKGGISGFLKREESEHDSFGAGHAGTSISAAVGMALARTQKNSEQYIIPIIGDGSLTSGMAFEALNHAGALGLKNFIVILNDNEMSISPNVGALSWLFSKTVTSGTSTFARRQFKYLHQHGYVPNFVYKAIDRAEEAAQGYFAPASFLFEGFGFRYIGPVDGHNIPELLTAIENAKRQDVPVVIHARTVKGKGYKPAEQDPLTWHGVKPFDRKQATFHSSSNKPSAPSYTSVFSKALCALAKQDKRIMGITAAMSTGTGLDKLQEELPNQFIDVGICEQHAVTCAAGMACEGLKPVCAIYSTFLQRGYDQIVHDVCIQNLPVVFAIDRAGAVGNDGETHQGVFDISYLRSLPNMTCMAPKDENELGQMLSTALSLPGPSAIRYPRGTGIGVEIDTNYPPLSVGKAEIVQSGQTALFLCFGPTTYTALQVAERMERELGITPTVINARFAKPLDTELLQKELPHYDFLYTIEDHARLGGFGTAVLECIEEEGIHVQRLPHRFGVGDHFLAHASQTEQYRENGYDAEGIYQKVVEDLNHSSLSSVSVG